VIFLLLSSFLHLHKDAADETEDQIEDYAAEKKMYHTFFLFPSYHKNKRDPEALLLEASFLPVLETCFDFMNKFISS